MTDGWGLDTSLVQSFKGEWSMMNVHCDMMLVVEAKPGKIDAVKEKLEEGLTRRIESYQWYANNGERCEEAKVVTKGNFAALVMVGVDDAAGDTAAAVSAFKKAAK